MRSAGIVLVVVFCTLAALLGPASEPEPADSDLVEQSQVRLVRLPVIFEERSPGGCDDLRTDRIEVLEDGAPVEITHVEPTHLKGVHAILMDSSRPMLNALQSSKRAAQGYIRSLPPNEPALLASFDDSLILHSPLTTDRARLVDDLIWVETGWGSNLWDATRQMIHYLRARSERKILVLLTDGCDTQSDSEAYPRDVIELAVRTSSLVVFPIVITPRSKCEDSRNTLDSLSAIAKETGGILHKLESARELESILSTLRARLESERYVTYRPVPFGSGPKDKPDRQSERWRKLEVRLSDKKACRIGLSGPARRLESARRGTFSGDEAELGDRVTKPFELGKSGWLAEGSIRDVVKDSGPLYHSTDGGIDRYATSPGRVTAERKLTALLPPLERVIRANARTDDVMIDALGLAGSIPKREGATGEDENWTGVPFLVNGRSMLDIRSSLARASFAHPDYRDWAYGKIRAERLALLDDLVSRGGQAIDPAQVRALKNILAGENWEPEPHELEKYLGAWLGDLPAVEMYTGVERRFAEAVLGMNDRAAAAAFVSDAEALWKNLAVWLPPPRDVRLFGLLVPGYDPGREVVGYYRVVLPRQESFLGTWEFSTETPLGFHLMNWMLGQESLAPLIRERFAVQAISYHKGLGQNFGELLSRETLNDLRRQFKWQRGRNVSLILARRDARGLNTTVQAFYATHAPKDGTPATEQFCILYPNQPFADEAEQRFFEALIDAKSRAPVPCVLKRGAQN